MKQPNTSHNAPVTAAGPMLPDVTSFGLTPPVDPPNPWRDAIPKCHWGSSCGRIGTKWIARHILYCDEHGSPWMQDAPWAELARKENR